MTTENNPANFAAFILTNGRPDNVKTHKTLRRLGYTGKIFLIIDDLDKTKDEYIEKYGDEVIVFDKVATAKTFDTGDNFNDMRAIVYARNACFSIAKDLGLEHFIQLDDDYTEFKFRFNDFLDFKYLTCRNMDSIFLAMVNFLEVSGCDSIAMSQGGDWIGGSESDLAKSIQLKRKAMNSFVCSTHRPFDFLGRVNEDVNTYTHQASKGLLFFTINFIQLDQAQTQSSEGGMTEMYLDSGTYIKSFYSVMYHPSGVKVRMMNSKNARLHHSVKWDNTTPLILNEDLKKAQSS